MQACLASTRLKKNLIAKHRCALLNWQTRLPGKLAHDSCAVKPRPDSPQHSEIHQPEWAASPELPVKITQVNESFGVLLLASYLQPPGATGAD
jgi:hypothetical protein